jgi:hypothetical protein
MTQLIKFFRRRRWMDSTSIVVAHGTPVGLPGAASGSSGYVPTFYILGF